jgi:3-oxoacyl-[acyl-carrier-protein] synthase II
VNAACQQRVVITGIGVVTPLGNNPEALRRRMQAGESAAASPAHFDARPFGSPVCAEIKDFQPQAYVSEPKLARLMNRDAQLAVAAARLAMQDAGISVGSTYLPGEIGLYGATGLAGLPVRDVAPLIRISSDSAGRFDLARFGSAGLKAVSPILSFKILSNMPFCFVSINENIQGPNAIYAPWEGDGAHAVEAGVRAVLAGDARCALVGGCDVKTHELAFATLQQQGLFSSWTKEGSGLVPAEGAAFLVLESERDAAHRRARTYAHLAEYSLRPHGTGRPVASARVAVLRDLGIREADALVSSADADAGGEDQESSLLAAAGILAKTKLYPKRQIGNAFAAAAPLQIALGAILARAGGERVLANCFGHGDTQAAFVIKRL